MADILIKGMEMPVQCVSCPMWSLEGAGNGKYVDWCRAAKTIVDPYRRPTNCPLIALPEGHGRLIDANELELDLVRHNGAIGFELIGNAPTIVPAEKEGTQ